MAARWIIVAGIVLVVIGVVWQVAPGLLNWFGHLPGDIHVRADNGRTRVFIPITSMIVISLILTLLLNLLGRH